MALVSMKVGATLPTLPLKDEPTARSTRMSGLPLASSHKHKLDGNRSGKDCTYYNFTVHRIQSGQHTTLQYREYRVDIIQLCSIENTGWTE